MADRPILVTGALGLIGNAARVALEDAGRPVVAVDRVAGEVAGRPVLAGDVTAVHRLHALALEHGGFAGILHCGAFSGPMVAADDPAAMVAVNITGTANMLELARIHRVPRLVFCSSVSAYGNTPDGLDPVPEATPLHPTSVYGASKAAGEALVDGYAAQHGVDGLALRIGWVYGPRRTTACAIRDMLQHARAGRPFHLPFGADHHRQYVHVDDVARALVLALDAERPGQRAYNINGGTRVTLGEIAGIVGRVVPGASLTLEPGPDPVDDRQAQFDLSTAERDLGFRPAIGLEDGIRRYAAWLAGDGG
ncbi:MAG: NAD(P)-dependent oxidoreductase [Geminicoccaceae bacterium]